MQFENEPVQGLTVDEANRESTLEGNDGCKYNFKNYDHRGDKSAGDIFKSNIRYHYQWDKTTIPKIGFVKFSSGDFTMQCGEPQCMEENTTTVAPITTQSTTPEVAEELSGDTCDNFLEILYSTDGFQSGVMKFQAPETTASWVIEVSNINIFLLFI